MLFNQFTQAPGLQTLVIDTLVDDQINLGPVAFGRTVGTDPSIIRARADFRDPVKGNL